MVNILLVVVFRKLVLPISTEVSGMLMKYLMDTVIKELIHQKNKVNERKLLKKQDNLKPF
jgi:hypothetical protein